MELVSGSVSVQPGTNLRLEGDLTWSIAPGTSLLNDGVIDLGYNAMLDEAPGEPVHGGGVELVRVVGSEPFTGVEPGGLGLNMTSASATGPALITRGHLPRMFPQGDPSISRWFNLEPEVPNTVSLDLQLTYDPVELGLLNANNLGLFVASDVEGPWSAVAGTNNAGSNSLSASLIDPWTHITAFDENAPTASPTLVATDRWQIWPTVTDHVLHILSSTEEAVTDLVVVDLCGRVIHRPGDTGRSVVMDVSSLAAGAYLLRVNGLQVFKFRKA